MRVIFADESFISDQQPSIEPHEFCVIAGVDIHDAKARLVSETFLRQARTIAQIDPIESPLHFNVLLKNSPAKAARLADEVLTLLVYAGVPIVVAAVTECNLTPAAPEHARRRTKQRAAYAFLRGLDHYLLVRNERALLVYSRVSHAAPETMHCSDPSPSDEQRWRTFLARVLSDSPPEDLQIILQRLLWEQSDMREWYSVEKRLVEPHYDNPITTIHPRIVLQNPYGSIELQIADVVSGTLFRVLRQAQHLTSSQTREAPEFAGTKSLLFGPNSNLHIFSYGVPPGSASRNATVKALELARFRAKIEDDDFHALRGVLGGTPGNTLGTRSTSAALTGQTRVQPQGGPSSTARLMVANRQARGVRRTTCLSSSGQVQPGVGVRHGCGRSTAFICINCSPCVLREQQRVVHAPWGLTPDRGSDAISLR